jgi:hypothetical protein
MRELYVYRMRTTCPECGEPVPIDGPALEITCHGCRSKLALVAADWHRLLDKRNFVEPQLSEGETRAWSLRSNELDVTMRFGPQHPTCGTCGARMDLSTCTPGMDGSLFCVKCGAPMTTAPAPPWLRAVEPKALQLLGLHPGPLSARAPVVARDATKPVSFTCPDCGGHLKITFDTQRIVSCTYCRADLYIPDALWRAMHPVVMRSPWYVGFA